MEKIITPKLFIKIDLDGKTVVPYRESHSFVSNYYSMITNFAMGITRSDTDTSGVAQATSYLTMYLRPYFGIIQVGSSNVAEDYDDYKLGDLIASGTSSGNLLSGTQLLSFGGTPPIKTRTITQTFINNSGGSVGVNEVGFVAYHLVSVSPTTYYSFLIARDVLDSTIDVADETTLNVAYTFSYSFPT